MKKIVIIFNVSIILFFFIKIVAMGGVLQAPVVAGTTASTEKRQSVEISTKTVPSAVKDSLEDGLAKPRNILTALEIKKKELEQKELFLKSEEQRIAVLKKEILEKIDLLRAEQEKMDAMIKNAQTVENKKYKDLAKVFDATPAAKAGAMLEKLDVRTAAGITMNMKRDKAGMIWGFLSPQKAVEITREITRTSQQ